MQNQKTFSLQGAMAMAAARWLLAAAVVAAVAVAAAPAAQAPGLGGEAALPITKARPRKLVQWPPFAISGVYVTCYHLI